MYLKSLTLKGFKSFADKTTLVFDPGLTVVVGPNGSGKSNISDAILWVLGEQSPKALRGQAMEDVIFSGSSARKPVSMAEVTLVLDNTDGTLPVDYADVAITRRMYRSGESEYLINGSPSRLMDITDILHDSGLGKDTHSIISQGHLDSVLSGRPEDRRELIEEAAGIAKHRKRKERSERKLKSMDENLTRAKDINREIHRQLKPLERQVTKAKRAHELQDELKRLSLSVAVDDLRRLQERHGKIEAQAKEADAAIEVAQMKLDQRSAELERYQSALEEKGIYVGDLDAQRRRLQGQLSQLEGDMRVLAEKGRNMDTRIHDLRESAQNAERDRKQAAEELASVTSELEAARAEWDELKRQADELAPEAKEATARRRSLGSQISRIQGDQQAAQRTADKETVAYAKLRDQVDNAEAEDEMYGSRLEELERSLASREERIAERTKRKEEVSSSLEDAQAQADAARGEIGDGEQKVREARAAEAAARERLAGQRASLAALRSVAQQAEQSSPLVAELTRHQGVNRLTKSRLGDLIEAPEELEDLVERLLGDDLNALVMEDGAAVSCVSKKAAAIPDASGKATLISDDIAAQFTPCTTAPGEALLDRLTVKPGAEKVVGALLGCVRLIGSVDEALAAHCEDFCCLYVTPEGILVMPDGRTIVGRDAGEEHGALERRRQIRELEEGVPALEEAQASAAKAVEQAEGALSEVRERSASAKGEVARLRGELSSVTAEIGRLEGERKSAASERQQVERKRAQAAERARSAREQIEGHRKASEEAAERAEELAAELKRVQSERSEASREESEANRRLSDAKLRLATVTERKNHLITREAELQKRSRRLEGTGSSSRASLEALVVRRRRVKPLQERYEAIHERAKAWSARVADKASLAEADSDQLKRTIADARRAVSEASSELERARSSQGDLKVERGRIEVQVENAVSAIEALGEPLERALTLSAPEDRAADERRIAELKRQVKSIGPVNEVAMDQYARLKERADYIGEQVEDLERARKALAKITEAIDRKMKRQFLVVFDQVNANFGEIFKLLFPGGEAHLEMTDPDNPAETGIEVVAQPEGKRIQKMMLMSGGEKSLTALALLFAVYKTRTVPFYVFDEIEAALDDANLSRLLDAIDTLRSTTQLIAISHQRRTMEDADVLYGVSMQADGVSHVVSQRLGHKGRTVDA